MDNSPNRQPISDQIEFAHSDTSFVTDKWLAGELKMAVPTIRSQRHKRRHGQRHWLDLDPVMIGSKPRYRLSDAKSWLAQLGDGTPNPHDPPRRNAASQCKVGQKGGHVDP